MPAPCPNRRLVPLLALVGGLAACAVQRPALDEPELLARREHYLAATREDLADLARKAVRRIVREHDEYRSGAVSERDTFDILVLSGGGDKGAFGAGFLDGWGAMTDADLRRPVFDVVTGVSTGALIAPFAFLGDPASYERIDALYQEPKTDWAVVRGMLFFLPWQQSFLNTDGLQRDIAAQVDPDVIARIAEESRKDRMILIGTTNLDLGILKAWRLTHEAERAADSGDGTRIHRILAASSAIPAAFPPVIIDDTLYVDGGTTSNILFEADQRAPGEIFDLLARAHPDVPPPRIRYWVIINGQFGAVPTVIQPSWPSITAASVSTAIRSSTLGSLRLLDAHVRLLRATRHADVELRFVAIPDDWRPVRPGTFVRETMQDLAALGRRMGQDPSSWRTGLMTEPDPPVSVVPDNAGEQTAPSDGGTSIAP